MRGAWIVPESRWNVESDRPETYMPVMWPWASYVSALRFSFCICTIGMKIPSFQSCYEDEKLNDVSKFTLLNTWLMRNKCLLVLEIAESGFKLRSLKPMRFMSCRLLYCHLHNRWLHRNKEHFAIYAFFEVQLWPMMMSRYIQGKLFILIITICSGDKSNFWKWIST